MPSGIVQKLCLSVEDAYASMVTTELIVRKSPLFDLAHHGSMERARAASRLCLGDRKGGSSAS